MDSDPHKITIIYFIKGEQYKDISYLHFSGVITTKSYFKKDNSKLTTWSSNYQNC